MHDRIIMYMNDLDEHLYHPFNDFEYTKVIDHYDQIEVILKLKSDKDLIGIYLSPKYAIKDSKVPFELMPNEIYEYNRALVFGFLYDAFSEEKVINLAIMTDVIQKRLQGYNQDKRG